MWHALRMAGEPQRPEPEGYRAGGTPGGRWGCIAASLFFLACLPLTGMMMFGDGGPPGAANRAFRDAFLLILATAAVLGLAARTLINLTLRRDTDKAPLWAILLLAAVVATVLWRVYAWALVPA